MDKNKQDEILTLKVIEVLENRGMNVVPRWLSVITHFISFGLGIYVGYILLPKVLEYIN